MLNKTNPEKFVVYFHNFARFDGYFLLKSILRNKPLRDFFDFDNILDVVFIGGQVLEIKIGSIYFRDSYKIAPFSLKKLRESLFPNDPSMRKMDFDTGKRNDLAGLKKIFANKKSLSDFLKYNKQDSLLLYKSMLNIQQTLWDYSKSDISDSITNPSFAMRQFLTHYYSFPVSKILVPTKKKGEYIPAFSKRRVTLQNHEVKEALFVSKPLFYEHIQKAFFGGRTELIKPSMGEGQNLDVNGLYSYAALSPLPFGSPVLIERLEKKLIPLKYVKTTMSFFYIEFCSTPDQRILPVLPRRHPNGYNIYALGKAKGWFFSGT